MLLLSFLLPTPFRILRHRGSHRPAHSSFFVEHNIPKPGIVLPPDFIHEYERVSKAPRRPVTEWRSKLPFRSGSFREVLRYGRAFPGVACSRGFALLSRTFLPLNRIVRKIKSGSLSRKPHGFLLGWRSSKPRWLICYLERTIWGSHQRIAPSYILCFLASLSRASVKLYVYRVR